MPRSQQLPEPYPKTGDPAFDRALEAIFAAATQGTYNEDIAAPGKSPLLTRTVQRGSEMHHESSIDGKTWRAAGRTAVDSAGRADRHFDRDAVVPDDGKVKVGTVGTKASAGKATIPGHPEPGSVTVETTAVTADSIILVVPYGTNTRSNGFKTNNVKPGTSFDIETLDGGTCVGDFTVAWWLVN